MNSLTPPPRSDASNSEAQGSRWPIGVADTPQIAITEKWGPKSWKVAYSGPYDVKRDGIPVPPQIERRKGPVALFTGYDGG